MILFRQDWAYAEGVVMDWQTRNQSALTLALKFKSVGIKNYGFFLALHDERLIGVDPMSPDLTEEQMKWIGVECRINPWYFFREVARAPALAGTEGRMVEFNRANISLWWSFFNHITYTLVQPRQTGKSFCTDLLMTNLYGFYCSNTQINLLTKDDKLRTENVKRLKKIYDELPRYLNMKRKDDVNNTEALSVKALKNYYLTHVSQASEKAANKLGRGLTTAILHLDEPPFQDNVRIAMEAASGAMGAAIDEAKRLGEPYGTILTTTAGPKDEKDGKFVYNYAMDSAPWTDKYYDAEDEEALVKMVRANSRTGVPRIYGCFSYKQLGKTDEWMREQLERVATGEESAESADKDFFNIWTSGSTKSPLDPDVIDRLNGSIKDPSAELISDIGMYLVNWYIPEDQIERYMATNSTIAGLDTSDAVGSDGIAFTLVDVKTGELIADANVTETNLLVFTQWLIRTIAKYPNMLLIPERRGSAVGIIDTMLEILPTMNIDPFTRIFNWVVNNPMEHRAAYEEVQMSMTRRSSDVYVRNKRYFGFATSGAGETARSHLYGAVLRIAMRRCAHLVKSRRVVEQFTSLENRNGRIDHPQGGHDDLVVAFLLCHWLLNNGKNLQHYGIDARQVMVAHHQAQVSNVRTFAEMDQFKIRQRIQEILTRMSDESEAFVIEAYEQELKALDQRLVLREGEYFSLDAVINQAREDRSNRRAAALHSYSANNPWSQPQYTGRVEQYSDTPMGRYW